MLKKPLSIVDQEKVELAMRIFVVLASLSPSLLEIPTERIAEQLARTVGLDENDFKRFCQFRKN